MAPSVFKYWLEFLTPISDSFQLPRPNAKTSQVSGYIWTLNTSSSPPDPSTWILHQLSQGDRIGENDIKPEHVSALLAAIENHHLTLTPTLSNSPNVSLKSPQNPKLCKNMRKARRSLRKLLDNVYEEQGLRVQESALVRGGESWWKYAVPEDVKVEGNILKLVNMENVERYTGSEIHQLGRMIEEGLIWIEVLDAGKNGPEDYHPANSGDCEVLIDPEVKVKSESESEGEGKHIDCNFDMGGKFGIDSPPSTPSIRNIGDAKYMTPRPSPKITLKVESIRAELEAKEAEIDSLKVQLEEDAGKRKQLKRNFDMLERKLYRLMTREEMREERMAKILKLMNEIDDDE